MDDSDFEALLTYLAKVPGIEGSIGHGGEDGMWWVKFGINISNPLGWRVVQELGHVLNYVSLEERLPTEFYPVSLPPYMNGGPEDFLSWVIENRDREFGPDKAREWLEGRLPRPVDDLLEWEIE